MYECISFTLTYITCKHVIHAGHSYSRVISRILEGIIPPNFFLGLQSHHTILLHLFFGQLPGRFFGQVFNLLAFDFILVRDTDGKHACMDDGHDGERVQMGSPGTGERCELNHYTVVKLAPLGPE